jgi:hypothetical protein
MPKQENNIDLQCILCTKNPNFSDVSHLLTHISSKSHLAARFKLQIQAQSDQGARDKLNHFDFWYRTSNIDALLAERMAAKELKKTKKSRNSTASSETAVSQHLTLSARPMLTFSLLDQKRKRPTFRCCRVYEVNPFRQHPSPRFPCPGSENASLAHNGKQQSSCGMGPKPHVTRL